MDPTAVGATLGGSATLQDRPRVIVSVTASVDGRVALSRSSTLMEPEAAAVWRSLHPAGAEQLMAQRRALLEIRHHPDVVLEGSGTFVVGTAAPPPALPATDLDATTLHEPHLPEAHDGRWFVVVDGRGWIRWTHTGEGSTRLLVLVSRTTPPPYLAYLRRERIPYLVAGSGRVDLALALRQMRTLLGAGCVVSEAGGGLNGALLRAGLVDELHLVLLPALVGARDAPTTFDGPPLGSSVMPTSLRLRDVQSTTDGAVWLHYDVDGRPKPASEAPPRGTRSETG